MYDCSYILHQLYKNQRKTRSCTLSCYLLVWLLCGFTFCSYWWHCGSVCYIKETRICAIGLRNVLDLSTFPYTDYRRLQLFAVANWFAMSLKETLFSRSFSRLSSPTEANRLLVSLLLISPILLNERSPEKLDIMRHIFTRDSRNCYSAS